MPTTISWSPVTPECFVTDRSRRLHSRSLFQLQARRLSPLTSARQTIPQLPGAITPPRAAPLSLNRESPPVPSSFPPSTTATLEANEIVQGGPFQPDWWRHDRGRRGCGHHRRCGVKPLFSDSFENGQWNGLWVEDSQNDWFTSTQRATDGSYSAEVDGSATDATLTLANPIDLTPYGSAELTFDWYIENGLDAGEYLALDLFDGSSWTEVARLSGNVDPEDTWHQATVPLDSSYLVDDFRLRFRAR